MKFSDRSSGHDNNFNLLRMLAATGVLISHAYPISLGNEAAQPLSYLLKGMTLGTLCVIIFFAISGFFIARSFSRKSSLESFLKARALRLFPALIVVLAVTVILAALVTTASSTTYWASVPEYYFRNLTLFFIKYNLPGVFTNNPYGSAINGSLWTLGYEVLCYLGVALCGILGFLEKPKLFGLAVILFLITYGLTINSEFYGRFERLMLLAFPFVTGMSFWVWRGHIPLSASLALVGGLAAALAWPTPIFAPLFTLAVSYAVFVLGYAQISWATAYNKLGDYSYGTYIYAFPIQQGVAWSGISAPFWNMAISIPLTLICAILSWHLVEAPALKWKRVKVSRPS